MGGVIAAGSGPGIRLRSLLGDRPALSIEYCIPPNQDSLLFGQSKPGQAFFAALDRGQILLSVPVFHELSAVLSREKFASYLLREERERFLTVFLRKAVLVEIHERVKVCRDPKDDM